MKFFAITILFFSLLATGTTALQGVAAEKSQREQREGQIFTLDAQYNNTMHQVDL